MRRLTIGLAVAAVVVLPLFWWSALPVVLAVSVLALASVLGRDRSPRPAVVTAWIVVAAAVALWVGSTLAEVL